LGRESDQLVIELYFNKKYKGVAWIDNEDWLYEEAGNREKEWMISKESFGKKSYRTPEYLSTETESDIPLTNSVSL